MDAPAQASGDGKARGVRVAVVAGAVLVGALVAGGVAYAAAAPAAATGGAVGGQGGFSVLPAQESPGYDCPLERGPADTPTATEL